MAKKSKAKSPAISDLSRNLLTGAAFGLYFGWFFRPQIAPRFLFAFFLAIAFTIVMFLFRLYQQGREESQTLLRATPLNFIQSFAVLAALEARDYFYEFGTTLMSNPVLGGRIVTTIVMVILGTLFGGFYYWRNNQK